MMQRIGCWTFAAMMIGNLAARAETPTERNASQQRARFFENEVRPLLVSQCVKCHGSEKQEGKLRLDSLSAMVKGGESGPAIEAGAPAKSLLVSAIKHKELEMPPNKRLSDEQISILEYWIEQGADWPESSDAGIELRRSKSLSDEDRNYWAFRPLIDRPVPNVASALDAQRVNNEIDAFIVAKLDENGLRLAPVATPQAIVRRLYFDLVGVPPTPAEFDVYKNDPPDEAYERLVDRLLDDPRYGQRWGRHWLDLVRYAESDGFKQDAYRPSAYLYRDYVINALNRDLPYDQFVVEQIAGDELPSADTSQLAATGYLRHWIYEYNQRDVRNQWNNILNDLTDVTGEVFLGLGIGCARCHDHKFDPILQKDYYRLQASFAAFLPRDDLPHGDASETATYQQRQREWETATSAIRSELAAIEKEQRDKSAAKAIDKFPPDIRPMLRRPREDRKPFEKQIAELALRQVGEEKIDFAKTLKGEIKERWQLLSDELAKFEAIKPEKRSNILAAGEIGPHAPPTFIPPVKENSQPIVPASLEVLGADPLVAIPPVSTNSTGRRTALAAWINSPTNPLPHRVIVNRVWQYHFGSGLVGNASDFGRLGQPPSHPELLDWLANWWLQNDRSFKRFHKLIVQSATYRQSSQHPDRTQFDLADHANRWLWHFPAKRLDAEQVRDSMLVASGLIDWKMGGPASDHKAYRRAIYTKVMRNTPDPMLNVLDGPDGSSSVAKRNVTTTPVQSLLLSNAPWPLGLSEEMASSLRSAEASTDDQIKLAYRRCYAREPTATELKNASAFLDQLNEPEENAGERNSYARALSDLCHVLFNSSEFLYID